MNEKIILAGTNSKKYQQGWDWKGIRSAREGGIRGEGCAKKNQKINKQGNVY